MTTEQKKQQEHEKLVQEMADKYKDIPSVVFDIEASDEMADQYYDAGLAWKRING